VFPTYSGGAGRKIPMSRLGGKETHVATDTENLLAERFREIRQEWDLKPGEAETKAQNQALAPLHAWLRTGMGAPDVVIRAVQVLIADPERPGIHKRPAVNYVFKQISKFWESAGFTAQDVLILKGMLLACWPQEPRSGGLALAPLLDSAWTAVPSNLNKEKQIEEWRKQVSVLPQAPHQEKPQKKASGESKIIKGNVKDIPVPDYTRAISEVENSGTHYSQALAANSAQLFTNHHAIIAALTGHLNATNKFLGQLDTRVAEISEQLSSTSRELSSHSSQTAQIDVFWWGQARYSSTKRQPYRRISDANERLWWMAWESSKLAMGLEVEPAASFLVENLYQLDKRADDQKRPLKQWLADLISTLRRVREDEQLTTAISMSTPLEKLAREDALGLAVTWARLQAANPRSDTSAMEERLREDVAVDPDTLLDLGDWAAWVFRESLLDRYLGAR